MDNKILVTKKININKASDRIRLSKWLCEFENIIFCENEFKLLWITFSKFKSKKVFLFSKEFNIISFIVI